MHAVRGAGHQAYAHLFPAGDSTWKDVFTLSPEIKIANDRALIRAANTNANKPAAHPPAPNNKPAAHPPAPNNKPAAAAGKQRPQSAPPSQKAKAPKPTPPQQKKQTAGRGRGGRRKA
jgi:hypothetical protein